MRSRGLKPGFFENPDLAEGGPCCQLLFEGLWCLADREGRLRDEWKKIRAKIFPYYMPEQFGGKNTDELLDYLASTKDEEGNPFIVRYCVEGKRYIQVVNFLKHQSPHASEKKSIIPSLYDLEVITHGCESTEDPHEIHCESTEDPLWKDPLDSLTPVFPDSLTPRKDSLSSSDDLSAEADESGDLPEWDKPERVPHSQIMKLYHEILPELPRVMDWTAERQKLLRARWKERPERQSLAWWEAYFKSVRTQGFLMGKGDKGWVADLEWLLRPKFMPRVLEGSISAGSLR